ncbi:MAG: MarR family transcriptional regulator [Halobacteria archaeon]
MRWRALPLLLLLALPTAGLRLTGQLYELGPGPDLQPATETLVVEARSNGELSGRTVASRGAYTLELGPGEYRILALSPAGEVRASENVSLRADARLDLILLPSLDLPDLPLNESLLGNLTLPAGRGERSLLWAGGVAVAAAAAGALLLLRLRKRRSEVAPPPSPGGLPDDLQAMLRALEREGGRTTQKELRRHLGYSEAKVSLMVADLENRGLVRKFKVGRGNIVVLEKGPEGSSQPPKAPQSDRKQNEGS